MQNRQKSDFPVIYLWRVSLSSQAPQAHFFEIWSPNSIENAQKSCLLITGPEFTKIFRCAGSRTHSVDFRIVSSMHNSLHLRTLRLCEDWCAGYGDSDCQMVLLLVVVMLMSFHSLTNFLTAVQCHVQSLYICTWFYKDSVMVPTSDL